MVSYAAAECFFLSYRFVVIVFSEEETTRRPQRRPIKSAAFASTTYRMHANPALDPASSLGVPRIGGVTLGVAQPQSRDLAPGIGGVSHLVDRFYDVSFLSTLRSKFLIHFFCVVSCNRCHVKVRPTWEISGGKVYRSGGSRFSTEGRKESTSSSVVRSCISRIFASACFMCFVRT